jgi:uncharacterized protein (TIGR02246 family)
MNYPKKAEEVHARLADAFNTGNVNTVLSMYEDTAILVPEPGKPVSGRAKLEEAVKGILAIKGKMEIKTVYCLQTGNVAVGRSEWNITDNGNVKISAKGIELMKQKPDGTWCIAIDHAFGAEHDLVAAKN